MGAYVPDGRIHEFVELVNALPGVTHHYGRDGALNLWFTLTAPSEQGLERALSDLRRRTGIAEVHSLPALTVYKVRVHFDMAGSTPPASSTPAPAPRSPVDLDERQKALVRLLQEDLPLVSEPFAELAGCLGVPVEDVLAQAAAFLDDGVIRRFGAVVNHLRLGYCANGMAVFNVPDERADEVGCALAAYEQVSHCYRRAPAEGWPYNLYAMVHARSHEEVRRFVREVADEHALREYDILFSTVEYKKAAMRYFEES